MTNASARSESDVNKVLESLILVSLSEIHGISGRKKLKREDFGENVELPPDVIVSLGSKKVIDPKLLNPFTQYKTKAHALCSAVGIRFLGGYAVPADRVNDLISSLNDVKTEFYIYKRTFLQSDFDSWIDQCEERYRKILRDGASVDVEYMENQIQFGFTAIHITPYGNSVIQEGIAGQIKSLTDEVFEEVSGLVDGFLKNLNQTAFTQHTINPLRRTAEKLSSLGFISDSVNKLAIYISDVLADVPVSGKVTGRKYSDILSLLNNLRDPQRAKSFVELLNANSSSNQSTVENGYIDLSPIAESLTLPVTDVDSSSLAVSVEAKPSADIAVDKDKTVASPDVVDDIFAESVYVVSTPHKPEACEPNAAISTVDQTSSENEIKSDGFPTDLPTGHEVIDEPELAPSPVISGLDSVSSKPDISDSVSNQSVRGFKDIEIVDEEYVDLTPPVSSTEAPISESYTGDGNNDGIFLF